MAKVKCRNGGSQSFHQPTRILEVVLNEEDPNHGPDTLFGQRHSNRTPPSSRGTTVRVPPRDRTALLASARPIPRCPSFVVAPISNMRAALAGRPTPRSRTT